MLLLLTEPPYFAKTFARLQSRIPAGFISCGSLAGRCSRSLLQGSQAPNPAQGDGMYQLVLVLELEKIQTHWNILVSWATAATAPDESQLNRIIGSIPAPSMFPGCSCSLQRFIRPVTARLSVQILCLDATGCVRFLRCLCTTSRSLTGASHLAEALTLVLGCLF